MPERSTRHLLSQEELNFLLAPTVDDAGGESAAAASDRDRAAAEMDWDQPEHGCVIQHIDTAGTLPERIFASHFERDLAQRLGAYVRLDLENSTRRECAALLRDLDSPAWYTMVDADWLSSRLLFCLDGRMTQSLADASLGAGVKRLDRRRLTSLDLALVRRACAGLCACLTQAWDLTACQVRREVRRPCDIFLTESKNPVRVISYHMEVESARGICRLVWPDTNPDSPG